MLEINPNLKEYSMMKPRKLSASQFVFGIAVLISFGSLQLQSDSSAFPAYRAMAVKQLRLVDKRVMCTYCHVNATGGDPWNPFGQEVQDALTENFPQTLYEVLKSKNDADGDGYFDALEVFAGSLPGDKNTMPLVDAQTLQKRFEKAGGFEMYKPQ
jgi:hypothetical protein